MTNYDMDELRRQGKVPDLEKRKEFAKDINKGEKKSVHDTRILGKDEEPWTAVDIEIADEDFIKIAHAAHTRDITINRMINIMLKDALAGAEYRFEHGNTPQLLNETK